MSIPKAPIGQGSLGPRAKEHNLVVANVQPAKRKQAVRKEQPKAKKSHKVSKPSGSTTAHRLTITRTRVAHPEETVSIPFPAFLYGANSIAPTTSNSKIEIPIDEETTSIIEVLNFNFEDEKNN